MNLFPLSDGGGWAFSEAEKNRVIILENVKGETVIITFGGPAVDFEEVLPKAQKILKTVEWNNVQESYGGKRAMYKFGYSRRQGLVLPPR